MSATEPSFRGFRSIAIVGVGLIGGSIAAAVKRRGLAESVVGIGRSRERLEAARSSGLVDVVSVEIAASAESELVVVCTPVQRIAADVREAVARSRCRAIVTDAGSVKGAICADLADGLPRGVSFVGAHPLAGSEKSGWEYADAELFQDRTCIVTPCLNDGTQAVQTVESFWQALGMRTQRMSADEHDRILAFTSHLPHAAAAALASLLTDNLYAFAATGFRDTTRIAAGDPDLWTGIFQLNARNIGDQLDLLIGRLTELRELTARQDAEGIHAWLAAAKRHRDRLEG
jgi:prephenate dehydrogenase